MASSVEEILREVLHKLGSIETSVHLLQQDVRDEKEVARENRSRIHARLDQQTRVQSETEGKIITVGLTLEQQRSSIDALKATVEENRKEAEAASKDWKRIKTLGWGFSGLLVVIGVTGGGILIMAGDISVALARKWLRID